MKLLVLFSILNSLGIAGLAQIDNNHIYRWGNFKNMWKVTEFPINSKHYYENTVNVLAPGENPACPYGKVIVMTGQKREDKRMIISNLLAADSSINTAHGTNITLPADASIETLATDNQIIKMNDGSLLAVKLGFLWSPISPKPYWGDLVSDHWSNYNKMARDGIFIYKSTDCGSTWTNISKIDAAKVGNGKYGAPIKADANDDNVQDKNVQGELLWHSMGFDRQEVYYDKWTGKIYISTYLESGSTKKPDGTIDSSDVSNIAVLVSSDNGITWELVKELKPQKTGNIKRNFAFTVMTSTPNGRFFMLSILTEKQGSSKKSFPYLFYTKQLHDYDLSSLDSVQIKCPKSGPGKEIEEDETIHQGSGMKTISLARGYNNSVYLSYQVLNEHNRNEYMVAHVNIDEHAGGTYKNLHYTCKTIRPDNEREYSLAYGTFIESPIEGKKIPAGSQYKLTPKTLFFYIESTAGRKEPKKDEVAVKAVLIDNRTNSFSNPFFLSRESGGARSFKPGPGIGHYTKGASYVHDDKQNYIAQWAEENGIHVSIVSGVEIWRKDDNEFLHSINVIPEKTVPKPPVRVNKQ